MRMFIIKTMGVLCLLLVIGATLVAYMIGKQMGGQFQFILPTLTFLISAFFAGGLLALVEIADNTRQLVRRLGPNQ